MINIITIQGRLTSDPEVQHTENDIAVCNFSIACDRSYTKEEKITDFFDCVAWRAKAEFLERSFSKGDMIALVGRLITDDYTDKNGSKRKSVKILVTEISFSGITKKFKDNNFNGLEGLAVSDEMAELANDEDLPF